MRSEPISVTACRDNPNLVFCPRCLHWHENKFNFSHEPGYVYPKEKPWLEGRESLCNDCCVTLLVHYNNHPAVDFIIENLTTRGICPTVYVKNNAIDLIRQKRMSIDDIDVFEDWWEKRVK